MPPLVVGWNRNYFCPIRKTSLTRSTHIPDIFFPSQYLDGVLRELEREVRRQRYGKGVSLDPARCSSYPFFANRG